MNLLCRSLVIGIASGLLANSTPLAAQETPADTRNTNLPTATATPSGGEDSAAPESAEDNSFREETIYIPYEKLQTIFEKEGRGVFVPYEKFQELWNAARKHVARVEPSKAPVDSLISEVNSDATIGESVVNVTATLKIEIIAQGWMTIPLRLNKSAIQSATIDGNAARIIFDSKTGHKLLYRNPTATPQMIELQIEYTRGYSKTPGQSSVSFQAPQAPINRWRIHVPEAGMAVRVEPMIAATQTPKGDKPDEAQTTELLAFVGAAPSVQILWNPKAEGASGLAAFATVRAEQQLVVSEGVVRTSTTLDYDISRSTLDSLTIEVPLDEKVVNVFDRNVKRWKVEKRDEIQRIQIDLFEATQGKQTVVVELERFTDAAESTYTVNVPVIKAIGVGRQQGVVVAKLEGALQGEATTRVGLMQLDQNDLPAKLRAQPWNFAYRYGAVPYELGLRIQKVLPRISVTELTDAHLATDELTLTWQGLYMIEDAGVFQLRVDVPDGYEIRSVHGKAIGDSQAVVVDSHHRVADDSPTILVNLSKRAFGKVGLTVELRRRLDDPNLRSPTGETSTIALPLPRAAQSDVEFSQGTIVVSAPESLRINPGKVSGLRSISFAEAYGSVSAAVLPSQLRPVLAFSFAAGATELAVSAERRRPQVVARQVIRCEITSGAVKYHADFFFDVKYSGVKELRIDVPTALTAEIRNTSKSIRQDDLTPAPTDVADGYTAWKFAGETELLGRVQIQLTWEEKIDELEVGKSRDIAVPRLTPIGVDRATGQIVLSKSESIDIQPTGQPSGLRPIDPQDDVMPEVKVPGAAMAFEFVGPWNLTIQAKRYELETSKWTSIDRGLVRIVVLGQDTLSVQAAYRMRSARQRLAIKLPEGAEFDAHPLRINGQPVNPERNSATEIFAPLVDQAVDETFLLELRFSMPGGPSLLTLPSFPDDPAVQKVYLCTYLPNRFSLLASHGPWADEQGDSPLPALGFLTAPSDESLIDWVSEDVEGAANSIRTFPTGKSRLFVYSALQPTANAEGSLRLTTVNRNVFNGLIILLVALIGLPFLGRSLRIQIAILLFATIVLLILGVLSPEFARSVFGGVFVIAIVIMLLLWLIGHLLKLRRLLSRWLSRRRSRDATTLGDESTAATSDASQSDASQSDASQSDASQSDASQTAESPPTDDSVSFKVDDEGEEEERNHD